jgi:hypothetical protein
MTFKKPVITLAAIALGAAALAHAPVAPAEQPPGQDIELGAHAARIQRGLPEIPLWLFS